MEITEVDINKIRPDKHQPRQTLDNDKIEDMANSIRTEGVINAIEVDENLVIVTGEMRWRAAKIAGLKTIPCKIIKIDGYERFRRQVVENIHNMTMTEWDTAKALEKLLLLPGSSKEEKKWNDKGISRLSREIGKPEQTISEYLRLLTASPTFQKAVQKNEIPMSMMRAINTVPEKFKPAMEEKIVEGEFETRDAARHVAAQIKNHPEKADELLKVDYSGKSYPQVIHEVNKIVPTASTQLREAYDPVKELSDIYRCLEDWMKRNHPHSFGKLFGSRVLMTFNAMEEQIYNWLELGKQTNTADKQLKGK